MQVRRKTPILEARQFTAESALSLMDDGWLTEIVTTGGETFGRVSRTVTRSRDVPLNGWIVLQHRAEPTFEVRDGTGMVRQEGGNAEPVRAFRPLSAEQFTEDFEVVPGTVWTPLVEASNGEMVNHPGMPIKAADPGVPTMDLLETDGPSKAKK